ncbi:MAG: hypothetical protein GF317_17205 [Candidatus Lokiarchaeota archaeon]|nr:hypothetical protein [Candidatus Lokiarchaeota archaeon]MBD3201251.1 hypothetical protein [Candidatus Lokiarchaeota archaeon]
MTRDVKGLLLSRLIVLIFIFLIPLAIFLIFIFVDFNLWWSADPNVTYWVVKVLCPIVFALSWLFFMILFANRISQTIDSMDKYISIIPLRLKLFYGMIAIVVLFIFIFPMITPIVSVLSFASIAWRATTFKKKDWDDSGTPFFTKVLIILASSVPLFCTVCIFPEYFILSSFLSAQIWVPLTDTIYTVSYCLCTALAIGSLFALVTHKGVAEYETIFASPDERKSNWWVKPLELVLFVFFLFLAYSNYEVIDIFYTAGFVIVVFVSIVNHFTEKTKSGKLRGHILGYLLAAVFLGSNLIIFSVEFSEFLSLISLVILAGVFIIVFFITFFFMEEENY